MEKNDVDVANNPPNKGRIEEISERKTETTPIIRLVRTEIHDERTICRFEALALEIIDRITRKTIADAAADNIRYLELRFTPVALSRAESFPSAEVMDWILNTAKEAEQNYHVRTS